VIPPNSGLAGSDEVITTAPDESWDNTAFGRSAITTADEFADDGDPWDEDFVDHETAVGRNRR
jgi:hypothetical protein